MEETNNGSDGEVLMQFQGLGETCEFGFAQRAIGIEPLHLFRFIGLLNPAEERLERMVAGLATGFSGLGQLENIVIIPQPEWNILCFAENRYSLFGHTGVRPGQQPHEKIRADLVIKLQFLRRKLLEDLSTGEKIFIWKSTVPLETGKVLYLFDALQEFGPNKMVWIPPINQQGTPGEIDIVAPGLVRATMTRKPTLGDLDAKTAAEWVLVCRRALQVLRGNAAAVPNSSGPTIVKLQ